MAEGRTVGALRRIPGEGALAAHAVGAAFVCWLVPRGFPPAHPRFWTNDVAPLLLLAISLAALVILLRERPRWAGVTLCWLAGAWLGAAVVARMLFPISLAAAWLLGVAAAIGLAASALWLPQRDRLLRADEAVGAVVGIALGAFFALGLDPGPPGTAPLDSDASTEIVGDPVTLVTQTNNETVRVDAGAYGIAYQPLLTFDRISPDRFWSLLAPASRARTRVQDAAGVRRFDDGAAFGVSSESGAARLDVSASTPVRVDAYSHLNAYCVLTIDGCREPSLSFSAAGARQFDILPAGYPSGAPARFACRMADGSFRVVEGASGEKGPYRELGKGSLPTGESLTVQFFDNGDWVASLTLDDWSAQASTDLSPTSGWGIPQNAIEFQRADPGGTVNVWISLASTSVGRGWDTVGHAAGVYRNRSRIEWRSDVSPPSE